MDSVTPVCTDAAQKFVEKWDEIEVFLQNLDDRVALAVMDIVMEGTRARRASRRWHVSEFSVYEAMKELTILLEEV